MAYSSKDKWISRDLSEAYWFQEGPGVRNWQFTSSGIKLLNVANITKLGTIDLDKTERCLSEEEVEKKYKHFLVDIGDLVIASSGISFDTDGLLRTRGAFVQKEHLPLCMNTSTIRFKAKEGVSDLNFLKFWLDSYEFREQITRLVTGSAQQNFGPSHLKSIQIKLPPLADQKRIAAIAQKADRLRRTRRYAIQLSDTYLRSVFLEMFGDPVTNPKGWQTGQLNELCDKVIDCSHSTPIYALDETPYACIRSSDIQKGYLDWSTTKYVDYDEYMKRVARSIPLLGDVIYCREGARFGNAAKIPTGKKVCLGQRMMLFRSDFKVATPEFIWGFLNCERTYQQAVRRVGGTASPHVNVEDIKAFATIIPPLHLQEKFAQIVQKFDRLRTQQREADRQAEHLFQTLLHRAFRGELTPQDSNDEPASVLLEEIGIKPAQAEEVIQLKLPGIE